MIAIIDPSPHGLSRFYDREQPGLRFSRKTLLAIGVVAAVHVGIGVVIAHSYFAAPAEQAKPEDPIFATMDRYEKPKPPPPKAVAAQPKTPPPLEYIQHDPPPVVQLAADNPEPIVIPHVEGVGTGVVAAVTPPAEPPKTVTAPPPPVITNPNWISRPTAQQVGDLYPVRAAQREIGGKATLLCEVMVTGAVNNCNIVDETPKGYGFGQAAQAMTRYFKLSPRTVDGVSVAGSKVRIPVVFNLG